MHALRADEVCKPISRLTVNCTCLGDSFSPLPYPTNPIHFGFVR